MRREVAREIYCQNRDARVVRTRARSDANNFRYFKLLPREKSSSEIAQQISADSSARNGDTCRAYYSTFDRASSRRASTRRDASNRSRRWTRSLAGTTTALRDRFRETFLLVSVFTFVQLLRHFYYFVKDRPHFRVRKSFRDSRVAQHFARPFPYVNGEFDDEVTIGWAQGTNDRQTCTSNAIGC